MKRTTSSWWWLGVLIVAGCSTQESSPVELPEIGEELPAATREVLENADRFEILALHPEPRSAGELTDEQKLGNYEILGQAELTARDDQREVLSLVYQGIRDSRGMVAACFNPRHGVRATRGDDVVEMVICYECLSMQVAHNLEIHNVLTARAVEKKITTLWGARGLRIHGQKQ